MVYSQSPPLVEKEWLTAEETSSGGRGRPIRSAHWYTAQEAVDPFSSFLQPQGRSGGQRPADDWQANIPHPYPVFYCGSLRCRRHACLAVPR